MTKYLLGVLCFVANFTPILATQNRFKAAFWRIVNVGKICTFSNALLEAFLTIAPSEEFFIEVQRVSEPILMKWTKERCLAEKGYRLVQCIEFQRLGISFCVYIKQLKGSPSLEFLREEFVVNGSHSLCHAIGDFCGGRQCKYGFGNEDGRPVLRVVN